eukprot:6204811-Pleurochrysis_carterae.AAC.3
MHGWSEALQRQRKGTRIEEAAYGARICVSRIRVRHEDAEIARAAWGVEEEEETRRLLLVRFVWRAPA